MFKQDKTINLSKNYLLLLPHTHGTRVRDVVGLREGRRKPWKLTRCWFLMEGRRRSDVESPPLFTSDGEVRARLLLYRDGGRRESVHEKQGERRSKLRKFDSRAFLSFFLACSCLAPQVWYFFCTFFSIFDKIYLFLAVKILFLLIGCF